MKELGFPGRLKIFLKVYRLFLSASVFFLFFFSVV